MIIEYGHALLQRSLRWISGCVVGLAIALPAAGDEGMFPISELGRLDLARHGLRLKPSEIFSADEVCLVDGICRVNGCTGSFVSGNGLIITNHHCAYDAIQNASSVQHDYLLDGFQARTLAEEIPAKGYTVRVTESFRDVSADVLSAVTEGMGSAERSRAIDKRRKELEQQAEREHPGLRAEVAEMFLGKTYVLFHYTYLKDIRLVFAPPSSVGNFGGEVDNWHWPRHTGDFSFMRAYVAPDGSSADYAPNNVPYQPKRVIEVAPEGVNEGDFVMLLGYPGRTVRHQTSDFIRYEQDVRLPYVVNLYGWAIRAMEAAGAEDRAVALKHAATIRGLANVEKRSRGQLQGLRRAGILAAREADEGKLRAFIAADPQRAQRFGKVLDEIQSVYREQSLRAPYELEMGSLRGLNRLFGIALTIYDAAVERQKPDLERESPYMDRNFDQTVQRLQLSLDELHAATDKLILVEMLGRLVEAAPFAPANTSTEWIARFEGDATATVEQLYNGSDLTDPAVVAECLKKSPEELAALDDAMLNFAIELYPHYLQLREAGKAREGQLGRLQGELIEVKQQFLQTDFVPDANGTLRLTFGRLRGYSPEDAVFKSPLTTLGGVVDKTTGVEPFITPQRIIELHRARDFGRFEHPTLHDVPVAILYDTDTTGGNSGSPILNADGRLVGVNFDRTFEATINDFAWNTDYSRSLGVDIRYVLWITGKVFGADHLLSEMGVSSGTTR